MSHQEALLTEIPNICDVFAGSIEVRHVSRSEANALKKVEFGGNVIVDSLVQSVLQYCFKQLRNEELVI